MEGICNGVQPGKDWTDTKTSQTYLTAQEAVSSPSLEVCKGCTPTYLEGHLRRGWPQWVIFPQVSCSTNRASLGGYSDPNSVQRVGSLVWGYFPGTSGAC